MADYYDVNGNKLASPAAAQSGEIYRDIEGKLLAYKDPITRMSETVAPIAGRLGAESLPAIGSLAGIGGTLVGTGIAQRLKSLKPEIFGEQPQGMDALGNAGKELLLNNALPAGLGKLGELVSGGRAGLAAKLSNFPAVREGAVQRMTQQIREQLGQAGNLEAFPTQEISVTPGREFQPFRKGQPFQMPTKPTVTVSSKPVLGENEFVNLMSKDKVNVDKALEEFTGKNASRYSEIMTPETYSSVKDMLGTMKDMQKKTTLDRIINYRQGRLVWGAGMGALAALGHPGTALLGEGLREGPVVLNAMLGKIMENPETAKLVTAALQTPASAPQAGLIQKALQVALPRLAQAGADVAATPER